MANRRINIPEGKLRGLYWDEGMSLNEIAEVFDTTGSTIWRRMKEYGIPRRDLASSSKINISEGMLRELYWGGMMSLREVSDELGVCVKTVYRRMKEYGIPRRGKCGKRLLDEKELEELYLAEGRTLSEVAEILHVSPLVVCESMEKYNIPRRSEEEESGV